MVTSTYEDFKYILQDVGHVYFGRELTYQEILEREDVPFKFKAILSAYISKESSFDVKFTDHLMSIDQEGFGFQIYKQLKMQIRIFYKEEKKGLFGTSTKWVHKTCNLEQFCNEYSKKIDYDTVMIEDISISKLALMTISI